MDFSLVPTDDLLEALKVRYTHIIFAGVKITGHARDEHQTAWDGHLVFCQGLAMSLLRDLQDFEREREHEDAE